MRTLSQMVDEIAAETRRPDLVTDIVRYVNQTIREVHFSPDRRAAQLFRSNFNEAELTTVTDSSYVWEIPNPATFQVLSAVKYPQVFDQAGNGLWVKEARPGVRQHDFTAYWYRVGESIVFTGYGDGGNKILVGFFAYPKSLKYVADPAERPAQYDDEDGWTYHADYDVDATTRETARNLTSNWLLLRWADVISEGVRAKVFKRVSDDARAKLAYSAYESMRQGLWTAESFEFLG